MFIRKMSLLSIYLRIMCHDETIRSENNSDAEHFCAIPRHFVLTTTFPPSPLLASDSIYLMVFHPFGNYNRMCRMKMRVIFIDIKNVLAQFPPYIRIL